MDLNPRVGGVDHYQGGAQQRPGTGAFARNRKRNDQGRRDGAGDGDEAPPAADLGVDPLLAEIDRLRALDPELTESGAHRALKAARAYLRPVPPADLLAAADPAASDPAPAPAPDPADPTPPDAATGSDVQAP